MQGADAIATNAVDKLKSFQFKLELYEKVNKRNFDMLFETLAYMQDISTVVQRVSLIMNRFSSLQIGIKRYFPDMSEGNLKVIRDSFYTNVASVNDSIQEKAY